MVESFYFLLTYADILVLERYVDPGQIAIYYAATKILALVAFVYFAVSAATAHRFAEYHVSGQREKLERFLSDSVKWTFWPSLAGTIMLLVLGKFLLSLFASFCFRSSAKASMPVTGFCSCSRSDYWRVRASARSSGS